MEKEYTFTMRSFRYRNNWAFYTVTHYGQNLKIFIGQSAGYPLPVMLQARQFGGNVFGTFKGYHDHNGLEYPRFWNMSAWLKEAPFVKKRSVIITLETCKRQIPSSEENRKQDKCHLTVRAVVLPYGGLW